MFTIRLWLNDEQLDGIKALDIRRKFGLKDATHISFAISSLDQEVTEAFARKYFRKNDSCRSVTLRFCNLQKGDLTPLSYTNLVQLNPDMPPERRVELYIKNRRRSH